MSYSWSGIRDDLARSSTTLQSQRDYRAMRTAEPDLQPYVDTAALLSALHHGHLDHGARNAILAALVRASQGADRIADLALRVLLLALWPGLDAIRSRCLRRGVGSRDEVASELLARTTEQVRTLDLSRVNRIAATVLWNVERDLLRGARRETARQQSCTSLEPDWLEAPPSWAEQLRLREELRRDLVAVIGRDADLVLGVALDGASQIEMGMALGLSEPAARKRYQRTVAALRQHHAPGGIGSHGSTTSTPTAMNGATSRVATG
ncbi:sigma-70 family RNA polymerase sigma factor [Paracoccus pantotrophus]|uniref:sigma-70 family RNA polymerase sigma factor n=1 Tax=Paracoccus pantotrophus TaxID=82367 RepID=UPI002181EE78|nr:sigma-70 family RNA polymerase sigma factor [Paracoccus pantotrophus]